MSFSNSIMDDELYLENIEEYVKDENKIVTYKWLSRTLSVSVTDAKQMLQNYIDRSQSSDLSVLYIITGESHDKNILVRLVPQEEKEECCHNLFSEVWTIQVYSVQKCTPKNTATLYNSDYQSMMDHLSSYMKWNTISNPTITTRQLPSTSGGHTTAESKTLPTPLINKQDKKSHTKESVGAFFKDSLQLPPPQVSEIKNTKNEKENSHKIQKTSTATEKKDFFTAGSGPNKKTTATKKKVTKTSLKEKTSAGNSKLQMRQEEDTIPIKQEEDKQEVTTHSTVSSKGKPKGKVPPQTQKKKKRILNMPSSSEESDAEEATRLKVSPKKVTSSPKKVTGGSSPLKQKGEKKRKRVKRLVTKMFAEDDGSMVTEKHWEEVSTDASSQEEEEIKTSKNIKTSPSKSKTTKKSLPHHKASGTTQSSLKSFFGNK